MKALQTLIRSNREVAKSGTHQLASTPGKSNLTAAAAHTQVFSGHQAPALSQAQQQTMHNVQSATTPNSTVSSPSYDAFLGIPGGNGPRKASGATTTVSGNRILPGDLGYKPKYTDTPTSGNLMGGLPDMGGTVAGSIPTKMYDSAAGPADAHVKHALNSGPARFLNKHMKLSDAGAFQYRGPERNALEQAGDVAGAMWSGSKKDKFKKTALGVGAYAGVNMIGRGVSGGGVTENNSGERDIMGIPFV